MEEEVLFWSKTITREQILPGSDLGITQCHRYNQTKFAQYVVINMYVYQKNAY